MAGNSHDHAGAFKEYTKVLLILFTLTALTVFTSRLALGAWAGPVAFVIAGAKAFFVMSVFMHLREDKPENKIIFATGFFFLMVLIFFCALDINTRVIETSTLN